MRRSRHRPPAWKPKADFVYVNVERVTSASTTNRFGEASQVWTTIYANMRCHFESLENRQFRGALVQTPAGLLSLSEFLMTFENVFVVKARDRIKDYAGLYYRVNDARPFGTHKEAFCDATEID